MMCEAEEDAYPDLPSLSRNSYYAAIRGGKEPNRYNAVKAPYAHPMKDEQLPGGKKRKVLDPTKPKRSYLKLMTIGKKEKMRCKTNIWGPGDKRMNYLDIIEVRGNASLVVAWKGGYYGV